MQDESRILEKWCLEGGGGKPRKSKAETQQWAGTEGAMGPIILIDVENAGAPRHRRKVTELALKFTLIFLLFWDSWNDVKYDLRVMKDDVANT